MSRQRIDLRTVTETALALVDREGFDSLSLAAVATALGVRPSALYTHVPSLDALREEMAVQATRNLGERVRDSAVGRSGDDAIYELAHAYRAFAREHPGQYASTLRLAARSGDALDGATAGLVDVFARVMAGCGIGEEHAVHAAHITRSAIHGFVALESAQGPAAADDADDADGPDAGFERLIATVLRGLR